MRYPVEEVASRTARTLVSDLSFAISSLCAIVCMCALKRSGAGQRRIVPSLAEEAIVRPSNDDATAVTSPRWPRRRCGLRPQAPRRSRTQETTEFVPAAENVAGFDEDRRGPPHRRLILRGRSGRGNCAHGRFENSTSPARCRRSSAGRKTSAYDRALARTEASRTDAAPVLQPLLENSEFWGGESRVAHRLARLCHMKAMCVRSAN